MRVVHLWSSYSPTWAQSYRTSRWVIVGPILLRGPGLSHSSDTTEAMILVTLWPPLKPGVNLSLTSITASEKPSRTIQCRAQRIGHGPTVRVRFQPARAAGRASPAVSLRTSRQHVLCAGSTIPSACSRMPPGGTNPEIPARRRRRPRYRTRIIRFNK